MSEYALNETNGKLHRKDCQYVKDTAVYRVSHTLTPIFADQTKRITCCKRCLKNDNEAQAAVEAYNNSRNGGR